MPLPESISGPTGDTVGTGLISKTILQVNATSFSAPITVEGNEVQDHPGFSSDTHSGAKTVATQFQYLIEGKAVCRVGDVASCGHPIVLAGANLGTVLVGP